MEVGGQRFTAQRLGGASFARGVLLAEEATTRWGAIDIASLGDGDVCWRNVLPTLRPYGTRMASGAGGIRVCDGLFADRRLRLAGTHCL